MTKKKFSLTSDLIEVKTEENNVISNNQSISDNSIINKIEVKKNDQVFLTIAIDEETRAEFKIWCVKNKLKMRDAFLEGFDLLKNTYI
jgi:hypothetical protein